MQGASPVSLQYRPDFFTPDPQQDPAPPGLPEQPEPPHWPQLAGQQITSLALMLSLGHSAILPQKTIYGGKRANRESPRWCYLWLAISFARGGIQKGEGLRQMVAVRLSSGRDRNQTIGTNTMKRAVSDQLTPLRAWTPPIVCTPW